MNPTHERVLRHFAWAHLPPHLQAISRPLEELALHMLQQCAEAPDPAEVTVGLRKLLEAKDCFVRSMVK